MPATRVDHEEGRDDGSVVLVGAGGLTVAFALAQVLEIVPVGSITPLFRLPTHLLGVTNVRGRVVPVSDLGLLLGSTPSRGKAGGRGLLVRRGDLEVVFSVSGVDGTRTVPRASRTEPPPTLPARLRAVSRGVLPGTPPVLLLDAFGLLDMPGEWPCGRAGPVQDP